MEKRELRTIITNPGGTAGQKSIAYRFTIPSKWAKDMGITKDDRLLEVTYDDKNKKIILKKKNQ